MTNESSPRRVSEGESSKALPDHDRAPGFANGIHRSSVFTCFFLQSLMLWATARPSRSDPSHYIFGAQQVAGQAWWFAVILATAILGWQR